MKEKLQALKEGVSHKVLLASVAVVGMVGSVAARADTTPFDFGTAFQPIYDQTTSNATKLATAAVGACVVVWGIYMGFRIGRKLVNKVA